MALPDFAREHISNDLPLTQGVGELEALAKQPEIRLAPPVRVTTAQASGTGTKADASTDEGAEESGFWTHWRKIGAFAVGVASIAGAAFAAIEVF